MSNTWRISVLQGWTIAFFKQGSFLYSGSESASPNRWSAREFPTILFLYIKTLKSHNCEVNKSNLFYGW